MAVTSDEKRGDGRKKLQKPPMTLNVSPRHALRDEAAGGPLEEPPCAEPVEEPKKRPIDAACDRIVELYRERGLLQANIDAELAKISAKNETARLISALFNLWARDGRYDDHMERSGHTRAIRNLVQQIAVLDSLEFSRDRPILGNRILEMSCGTGTVLKEICDVLPQGMAGELEIVANDISQGMKAIAKKALANCRARSVKFTCRDLRELEFGDEAPFKTAILSQTLHLLASEKGLGLEREAGNRVYIEEMAAEATARIERLHLDAKADVFARGFNQLAPGGTLILIDEWPAKFTRSHASCPEETAVEELFSATFRPVERDRLLERITEMKHDSLPEARFVAELKVPIDNRHAMYAFVYRKDPDRVAHRGEPLPYERRFFAARKAAVLKLEESFRMIDRHAVDSLQPAGGGRQWVKFLPIPAFREDENEVLMRGYGRNSLKKEQDRYNYVVLPRLFHRMTDAGRERLVETAVRSLRIGGALLVADEWPAPSGRHPIRRTELREFMASFGPDMRKPGEPQLIFSGAMRVPILSPYYSGMYGYLYRRIK